jgi:hypothetical protein
MLNFYLLTIKISFVLERMESLVPPTYLWSTHLPQAKQALNKKTPKLEGGENPESGPLSEKKKKKTKSR